MSRRATLVCFCVISATLLPGCRRPPPVAPPGVSSAVERGPLRLIVSATPAQVWIGDPVRVDVEFTATSEFGAVLPGIAAFEPLSAAAAGGDGPSADSAGRVRWRQSFIVEPMASGTLEIPPLVVRYGRALPDGAAGPGATTRAQEYDSELVSNTLKVEVRSALTTQDSVSSPRDITGTLLPPWRPTLRDVLVWSGLAAGCALIVTLITWLVRRRLLRPAPPMLPEVWALRELAALGGRDWLETGRAREWYYGLSEVVRTYIERKFALAAPEMTTEEFLARLARDRGALPYDSRRLGQFLETCDIVKYAAFTPQRSDGEAALETARAFVHATAAAAAEHAAAQAAARAAEAAGGPRPPMSAGGPAISGSSPSSGGQAA